MTTRQKMLLGGVELLRERGAAGVTIDAILARTATPRGSVYHHFPGGRGQIISESLDLAGDAIAAIIDESLQDGPVAGLERFGAFWKQILRDSDFEAGCPVIAVAVGGAPDDELSHKVAAIVQRWQTSLRACLVTAGLSPQRAVPLATMAMASIEGAVILCRTTRTITPLDDVIGELTGMLAIVIPRR
ncbi:TetR/AcrR family transcriptional regulator [Nocardia sp. NPDC058666]|uniref:TetR/AcrR family transcriptional regulator n=1 Tax=Nocardia sp. NPDC058666 TaxID=3346587 RepID=UPI003654F68A